MASEADQDQRSAMPPPAVVPRSSNAASSNDMDIDATAATAATLGQDPSSIASTSKDATRQRPNVDIVSRVEGDLALLLQIMSSSLHYIANRSAHVQLNEAIPLFQPVSGQAMSASRGLLDRATMAENIEELTDDLLAKAKDMERHIAMLPGQRRQSLAVGTSASASDKKRSNETSELDAPLASRRTRRGSRQQVDQVEPAEEKEEGIEGETVAQAPDEDEQIKAELRDIDEQMRGANAEYREALKEAKSLKAELDGLLRHVCDEHQAARAWLADAATQQANTSEASSTAAQKK